MMVKIDKKRKYFLIVMIFLLVAGVVYRVWPEINDIFADDDTIALKKKQLIKYQKMFQSVSELERNIALLKTTLKAGEGGLLTGETPALAAANIQQVVQEIAKKCEVQITSVRVLKPIDVGGSHYLSIPVQLSVSGAIRHLKEFMYQIMNSPKYLTVQKVKIIVRRNRRRGKTTQHIRADITVNGFLGNLR
jgi:general secretion pathway protein M